MRKIPFKILHSQQFLAHLRLCSLQTLSKADIISLKMSHSARVSPYSIRCRRKVLRLDIASICQNKSDSYIAYSIGFSTAEITEANNDSDHKLNHTPLRLRVAPLLPFMTGVKVRDVSRWHISIPFQFSHFTCLQHTGRAPPYRPPLQCHASAVSAQHIYIASGSYSNASHLSEL